MAALTKNAIVAAVDLTKERADVPEWGGYVYVSSMTGTDRDAWESEIISVGENGTAKQTLDNIRAKLLSKTIVNDNGDRIFDDPVELGKKSGAVLGRLFEVAKKLNAVSNDDVDELAKN